MPMIETDSQNYTDIADAIRAMNGTQDIYYPNEMAAAIRSIPQETYDVFAPIIYSLEEREVGVWKDGKPLYQKTVHINSLPSSTTSVSYPHNISNIDTICSSIAYIRWSSGNIAPLNTAQMNTTSFVYGASFFYIVSKTDIQITVGMDRSSASADVTIQYTKTTDVPGSGQWTPSGVPAVHYDGTERVIGTWFGETLYETVVTGLNVSVSSNWGTEFVTTLSIKDLIDAKFWDASNPTNTIMLSIDEVQVLNGGIRIRSSQSDIVNYRHITQAILRYTKTT